MVARVGEIVRDGLEGAERLVELVARLGVVDRHLERALGAAHRLRREQDDALVHHLVPGRPTRPRAAPMRSDSATGTSSNDDLVLRVGGHAELLRQRRRPERSGRRGRGRRHARPCRVRASTSRRVAARANCTCRLVPWSRYACRRSRVAARSDARRAVSALRLEPRRREDRLAGRDLRAATRRFCASLPARASTPALMTALTKCGDGASARPSSS